MVAAKAVVPALIQLVAEEANLKSLSTFELPNVSLSAAKGELVGSAATLFRKVLPIPYESALSA